MNHKEDSVKEELGLQEQQNDNDSAWNMNQVTETKIPTPTESMVTTGTALSEAQEVVQEEAVNAKLNETADDTYLDYGNDKSKTESEEEELGSNIANNTNN